MKRPAAILLFMVLGLVSALPMAGAADPDPLQLERRWTVIAPPAGQKPGQSPFESLTDFKFVGPNNDPNVIGEYKADGEWGLSGRVFQQTSGEAAAVKLGRAEDFSLEAVANFDGTGGWFLMMGSDGEAGHVLSHSSLRQNDYWRTYPLRGGRADKFGVKTHSDSFRPRGDQPMWIIVKDGKLSLRIGETVVLREHELDGYAEGDIVLGSFKNQYGVKLLKFKALRVRALR
ncbi:hypothetical protein [Stratiformator vulcanicus]|uniref:3-keto-disaccharide hydrolase domain-containing protein n=1 Tax=Stratiformator vulcanicus TaxID=2527980 RepID=A0A517R581_9PLAN|nr:hypothetical protein [Stratiformator vulcanicus]QDT39022.1 hypothetical protein Pan189_34230 [Stratiformator vulcanicus]